MTQVDVENLHAVVGRSVEEALNVLSRHHVALCQRAVAHGAARGGNLFNLGREGDVVPCHVLLDVVDGDASLGEGHLHGAGGIGHAGHEILELVLFERLDGLFGEFVVAERADGDGVVLAQELPSVISEIGGGATQFFPFGKHVPQGLAETHYITFFSHNRILSGFKLFDVGN